MFVIFCHIVHGGEHVVVVHGWGDLPKYSNELGRWSCVKKMSLFELTVHKER